LESSRKLCCFGFKQTFKIGETTTPDSDATLSKKNNQQQLPLLKRLLRAAFFVQTENVRTKHLEYNGNK